MPTQTPPRWDLSNVYPSLSSPKYVNDFTQLNQLLTEQENLLIEKAAVMDNKTDAGKLASLAKALIDQYNDILVLAGTLRSYLESFISTDSYNKEALKKQSEFDQARVKLDKVEVMMTAWIGKNAERLPEMLNTEPELHAHEYFLKECIKQSQFLMSEEEEVLA